METKSIKWSRPEENRFGHLVYTSKCGRFTITKKKFIMPFVCVGYILEGVGVDVPKMYRENDSLAQAKQSAADVVNPEAS